MTLANIAYPVFAAYTFAFVAAAVIAATMFRRSLKLSGAALTVLAALFLLGAWDLHERLLNGGNSFRALVAAQDWLRILFMAIAYDQVMRVIVRVGGTRIRTEDALYTDQGPKLLYLFSIAWFIRIFIQEHGFGAGFLNGFASASWGFGLVMAPGVIRMVNRLRPQALDPNNKLRRFFGEGNVNPEWLGGPIEIFPKPPVERFEEVRLTDVDAGNLASMFAVSIVACLPSVLNFAGWSNRPVVELATAILSVLLLPCFFGMIQFQARGLFFDVVVKRGILFSVITAFILFAFAPFQLNPELKTTLAVIAVSFIGGWVWLYGKAIPLLDSVIFHRHDYAQALNTLTQGMSKCATEDDLILNVRTSLAQAMRADWVEWSQQLDKPETAAVAKVAAGDRVFGYLLCGPRYRSQPYRSEDLQFLDSAGAHFASALQGFEARRLEELAARSELKALRAQINPHFLFNALNTLADMSHSTPEAEKAIMNLSRVFRFALDSTRRESLPLREEVAFIRSYLEIEKARFESKLRFSIDVPEKLMDHLVPPMLLQPLVENAIKHGLSRKVDGGWVRVSAIPSNRGLTFTVEDNGIGFEPAKLAENIGLSNVRSRVEALGGHWSVDATPGRGASFRFDLPAAEVAA